MTPADHPAHPATGAPAPPAAPTAAGPDADAASPAPADALRRRANTQLRGSPDAALTRSSRTDALSVLHDLAGSPVTAGDALALLHELQVHQVELDLQQEELQRAHAELSLALQRQSDWIELAPVAYLSLDAALCVREVNAHAAERLGESRECLLGQPLRRWLAPDCAEVWLAWLAGLNADPVDPPATHPQRPQRHQRDLPWPATEHARVRTVRAWVTLDRAVARSTTGTSTSTSTDTTTSATPRAAAEHPPGLLLAWLDPVDHADLCGVGGAR